MSAVGGPLTLGTAGHVDHGKTALVAALTGVDTDRLQEERRRGLSIVLGYAPLVLPSGRRLSVVDVPGHERFVRTMVVGATGVDAFLMVVAADDGVMPQTIEHAAVLRGLGVTAGVVAVTKVDLADPARAIGESRELLGGCEVVACSARTGAGVGRLAEELDRLAGRLPSRAAAPGATRLHIDRCFSLPGRGTVVTGTLWSGEIAVGDELELIHHDSGRRAVRVRGVHVHDHAVERAGAGQRVAVNLARVRVREVVRGDLLAAEGAVRGAVVLDCALALDGARHGERVQVHHGARDVPGRLCELGDGLWQLRLERRLLALAGDRVVVRRLAPPVTLGGGAVLDAAARRHGGRPEIVARLRALRDGEGPVAAEPPSPARPAGTPRVATIAGEPAAAAAEHRRTAGGGRAVGAGGAEPGAEPGEGAALAALEARLREAGAGMLSEAALAGEGAALGELRAAGRAVRVSGRLYAHADVAAAVEERIVMLLSRDGAVTLPGVRDELRISRRCAQAFLEHLDRRRVTRRLPDDRRVLRRGAAVGHEDAG